MSVIMLELVVWLIHVATANFVCYFRIFIQVFHWFNHIGKQDIEQYCPDMCGTYNSTELDKVTPTYGGKTLFYESNNHFNFLS